MIGLNTTEVQGLNRWSHCSQRPAGLDHPEWPGHTRAALKGEVAVLISPQPFFTAFWRLFRGMVDHGWGHV